ncbi:MAG TPA: hypothetical protein VF189_05690 [Patescibacteria group bacterium]
MEKYKSLMVQVDALYTPIHRRVLECGNPTKITTWKKAFPHVDFGKMIDGKEVDDALTGDPINWESRPLDDRFMNVAMQESRRRSRLNVEVNYELNVAGVYNPIKHSISDSERQWYLLFDGALRERRIIGRRTIPDGAMKTLVYFATQKNIYNEINRPVDPTNEEEIMYKRELEDEYNCMLDAVDEPKRAKLRRLTVLVPREVVDSFNKERSVSTKT